MTYRIVSYERLRMTNDWRPTFSLILGQWCNRTIQALYKTINKNCIWLTAKTTCQLQVSHFRHAHIECGAVTYVFNGRAILPLILDSGTTVTTRYIKKKTVEIGSTHKIDAYRNKSSKTQSGRDWVLIHPNNKWTWSTYLRVTYS